jgi:indolepyruvate ferredoxin oxidoreductase beta subunit
MTQRSTKLCIAALGGQGGGVLAQWLVEIAEASGYLSQSTSVPGVAQRTGATLYYLEFFPRESAEHARSEPIMALAPVPGDVDCVVASELVEAGRAVQRGLVTADRTTLIASSHRAYAISEKSALGRGIANSTEIVPLIRRSAKRAVIFDMDAIAQRHKCVVSSVLLGAICGAEVLPFGRDAFEAAIKKSGLAVASNLAAFADALEYAHRPDELPRSAGASALPQAIPTQARNVELQPLLDRLRKLPGEVQALALEGVRRTLDYQDVAYAALYMNRVERVQALEQQAKQGCAADIPGINQWALTNAVVRSLALWMTFEDTIRVADLKTRSTRFARVREEIRANPDQLFGITEFMSPRVEEIAGTLPARLGAWVSASPRASRGLRRWTGGKRIRTSTVSGFLLLYLLAGFRRWRRGTLRYQQENQRIEDWLSRVELLAVPHYALAVELARAQRLIKGYGETHERGWRNFSILLSRLDNLAERTDGAEVLARLHEAALADEDGRALARELAACGLEQGNGVAAGATSASVTRSLGG